MTKIEVDVAVLGCGIVGSYLAATLVDAGARVAIVERGPSPGTPARAAMPAVVSTRRRHKGVVDARRHEAGGNSAHWGGAMLRMPEDDLSAIVGADRNAGAELARAYARVEHRLGFPREPRRATDDRLGCRRAEALVLPTAVKNVFAHLAAPRLARLHSFFDAEIHAVTARDGRLRAVQVHQHEHGLTELRADTYLLTMGAVDSNLFAWRFATSLFDGPAPSGLGACLHDHLSVPLYEVRATGGGDFLSAVAPRFEGGFLSIPRFEFSAGGPDSPRAFLHFVFDFDQSPTYAAIKRLLAKRQARAAPLELLSAIGGLLPHAGELARIGVARLRSHALHVSRSVAVTAVLDFESTPDVANCFRFARTSRGSECAIDWDVREADVSAFQRLHAKATEIIAALAARHGFEVTPAIGSSNDETLRTLLLTRGTDVLHLGGGLQGSAAGPHAVLGGQLAFPAATNLLTVSTAVLARPGVANPTHTLLALADQAAHALAAARTAGPEVVAGPTADGTTHGVGRTTRPDRDGRRNSTDAAGGGPRAPRTRRRPLEHGQ